MFILPITLNQVARADGLKPICSSGGIYGGGIESSFTIKLTCSNLPAAVSYSTADGSVLMIESSGISIQNDTGINPPESVSVGGDELSLVFNSMYGSRVRDIAISAGSITNDLGFKNDDIMVYTADIADYAIPLAKDDSYSANQGYVLNVPADLGVLANDSDGETSVVSAEVSVEPTKGALSLNADGSFTYMPSDDYDGSDFFVYTAADEVGNLNTATVLLNDTAPSINSPNFYRDDPNEDPNFAKVGDTVRVDFETNEPVTVNNVTISDHVVDVEVLDSTHFSFSYVMQDGDKEGMIVYTINVHDSVGMANSLSNSDGTGVYFDKTKPVIDLGGSDYIELEVNVPYDETVSAYDELEGQVTVYFDINVDTSTAGTYVINYSANDSAGNQADVVTRTVVILDSITMDFRAISDDLKLLGLDNNLDTVNSNNCANFSGLYIEKSLDGVKLGRITFNNEIDLSDPVVLAFLNELAARIKSDKVGEIGFDVSGMDDLLAYFGTDITIKFYNLDKLGFNNSSKLNDVFSRLDVYDDNGDKINGSSFDKKDGVYVGCNVGQIECYTFTLKINHFSKYVINKITYQKNDSTGAVVGQAQSAPSVLGGLNNQAFARNNQVDNIYQTEQQETLGAQTSDKASEAVTATKKDTKAKVDSKVVGGLKAQWWLMVLMAIGLLYWITIAFIEWRNRNN